VPTVLTQNHLTSRWCESLDTLVDRTISSTEKSLV